MNHEKLHKYLVFQLYKNDAYNVSCNVIRSNLRVDFLHSTRYKRETRKTFIGNLQGNAKKNSSLRPHMGV